MDALPSIASNNALEVPETSHHTDTEILVPLIPTAKEGGHPHTTDMRAVCNVFYYHLKTVC